MVTAHAQAVGGVDDAGAGRATMISVSRFLGARSCSSSSGRSLGQVHFTKPSRWHLSSRLGIIIAVRLRSATTRHSHAHPELDRNAFLPRCAAAAASWAWAGGGAHAGGRGIGRRAVRPSPWTCWGTGGHRCHHGTPSSCWCRSLSLLLAAERARGGLLKPLGVTCAVSFDTIACPWLMSFPLG